MFAPPVFLVQQPVVPPPVEYEPVWRGTKHLRFTRQDDDRLIAIVRHHDPTGISSRDTWELIARQFGGPFTATQLHARWQNFLRPPLNRLMFSADEKRDVLKKSIGNFGRWKDLAECVGDGRSRSPRMIKAMLMALISKLKKCGIDYRTAADVDCIPEVVFGAGLPEDVTAADVRAEFLRNKQALAEQRQ